MPKVSICLTTWERANQLPKTIDSLLEQTFTDFELIIQDGCSSDATEYIGSSYEEIDSRVKYYRNNQRLLMPGNLNAAIEKASGEFIANLHDGDTFKNTLILDWVNLLDKYPSAAFVFNAYESLDENGEHRRYYFHDFPELIRGIDLLDNMLNRWDSPVRGTVMVRRSCYDEQGLFDPQFGHISDVDMWMRFAAHYDVAYVRKPLIRTSARERDHPFNKWLWKGHDNIYKIHYKNLQRRYRDDQDTLEKKLKLLNRRSVPYFFWILLSCLKKRNKSLYEEGLYYFQSSSILPLNLIGIIGRPFLYILHDSSKV